MGILTRRHVVSLSREAMLVGTFTVLMVIAAYIRIPLFFSPVPITLQTCVLFLSIAVLRHRAFLSHSIYLFLGVIGVPVFGNGGAGYLYLLGPTGGYIIGFLVVAFLAPYFFSEKMSFVRTLCVFLFANILIYLLGIGWLMIAYRYPFILSVQAGVIPFVVGDIFKIIVASIASLKVRSIRW